MQIHPTRLHHVAITCADYARSKHFYTETFGLHVVAESPRSIGGARQLDLAFADGSQITLLSRTDATPADEAIPARHLFSSSRPLLAFEVQDVQAVAADLASQGLTVEAMRIDESSGQRFICVSDPDGLPLRLYESPPGLGAPAALSSWLLKLELALQKNEVRSSVERMAALLDDDFQELGKSGRSWSKQELLEIMINEPCTERRISDFKAKQLGPDMVLTTYLLHRGATPDRPADEAMRSSIWRRSQGRWRMVFHQGIAP